MNISQKILCHNDTEFPFFYDILIPEENPRGILLVLPEPHNVSFNSPSFIDEILKNGYCAAVMIPQKTGLELIDHIEACRTLIDIIRQKYKFLPIIALGTDLASISARALGECEMDRISGLILAKPTFPKLSGFTKAYAKFICAIKGEEYRSGILGDYKAPLRTTLSFLQKANMLDSEIGIAEYPKHIPTLIINAENDILFNALDDAYVSLVEKASANSEQEGFPIVFDFVQRVVQGVSDALSSDSFIYRGTGL